MRRPVPVATPRFLTVRQMSDKLPNAPDGAAAADQRLTTDKTHPESGKPFMFH
jgi:hypothetical protein